MPEPMDRRTLLSALIGAGVGLTTLAPAAAAAAPDEVHDHDQEPGNDVARQLRELAKLGEILQKALDRYDKIFQGFLPPPPTDVPSYAAVLMAIAAEGQQITQVSQEMLALLLNP